MPNEENVTKNGKALYALIKDAMKEDGALPENFFLPSEETDTLLFCDGALDAMGIYPARDGAPETFEAVLQRIAEGWVDAAYETLHSFFAGPERPRMLSLPGGPAQAWDRGQDIDVPEEALRQFALEIMSTSDHAECVKFGMALYEAVHGGCGDRDKEIIRTLSLCSEFTALGLSLMRRWEDSNREIFNIAQKVDGWGKIHAVQQLEPEDDEIRDWLFREGWRNGLALPYAGLYCARKTGFADILRRKDLSSDDLDAASGLLEALLDRAPVADISEMEDRIEILELFLARAEELAGTEAAYGAVVTVKQFLKVELDGEMSDFASAEDMKRLAAACRGILDANRCRDTVRKLIAGGTGFMLAKALDIECTAEMLRALEEDFEKNYILVLEITGRKNWEKVLEIARRHLPLRDMMRGPSNSLLRFSNEEHLLGFILQELDECPGLGEDFVICGLDCPSVYCRNTALRIIDGWLRAGYPLSAPLKDAFETLRKNEVCEDVRNLLDAVVTGSGYSQFIGNLEIRLLPSRPQ